MANETLICIGCQHRKTAHSREGCKEWTNISKGIECICKIKYNEAAKFRYGIPREPQQ